MKTDPFFILYIEDNATHAFLISQLLKRIPCVTLLEASDAYIGVQIAKSERPHLILMDISLPGMCGYKALEILKSDTETRNIPVIATSAYAYESDILMGKNAGFVDYITKPIRISDFISLMERYINQFETTRMG